MKKIIVKVALLACAALAGNVQAVGVSGQGTWETTLLGRDINGNAVAGSDPSAVFLYDGVLNVTWLRNASAAGRKNWAQADAWATNLVVGAYDDWRLPTMISTPDATFSNSGGTDHGFNVRTKSGNATQFEAGQTVFSEMAHLWYSTLGNKAYCAPGIASCSGSPPQPGWGLTNTGDFQNLEAYLYWSGLEYAPNSNDAWVFLTYEGAQVYGAKAGGLNAMAVRDGDVAAVPLPATAWLMLAGLGALGVVVRRRRAA